MTQYDKMIAKLVKKYSKIDPLDKSKKLPYIYVSKEKDPVIKDSSHSELFNQMKKRPHS